jgi:hypothetical protein
MVEAYVFDNSVQGNVAEPSFLYLVMAATYFRPASRARQPIMRDALLDFGREYASNAHRVVPVHAYPGSDLNHSKPNTQS